MFPRMRESQFLIHCMRNMEHSAVMELLYRIVSGLSNVEQQDCMKKVSVNVRHLFCDCVQLFY